mmetsp:Transcript_67888/g.155767  ORF Transcript_67888/g.155767 Transcript_67888/m.155767 type:complete len:1585 (+) Transcript_67888:167-4921(+)
MAPLQPPKDDKKGNALEVDNTVSRTRIYYNRLVGDDILSDQKAYRAKSGLWEIVTFVVYAIIATLVIVGRSDVFTQYTVNSAVRTALTTVPFEVSPQTLFFDDIATVDDVKKWLRFSLLPQLFEFESGDSNDDRSQAYSLLSFNRITPNRDVVSEGNVEGLSEPDASIRLTVRKMKRQDGSEVVGSRFAPLHPTSWSNFRVPVDASSEDDDDTEPLTGFYNYDPDLKIDGLTKIGKKRVLGENRTIEISNYTELEIGERVETTWRHSSGPGSFAAAGGYACNLNLYMSSEEMSMLDSTRLANGRVDPVVIANSILPRQVVSLLVESDSLGSATTTGSTTASTPAWELTNALRLDQFLQTAFLDEWTSVVAIDFVVYNPNYKTISYVTVVFSWNAAGSLHSKEVRSSTLKMDLASEYLRLLEMLYMLMTIMYLGFQFMALYKLKWGFFHDFWSYLDILSTTMSVMSLSTWTRYERRDENMKSSSPDFFPSIETIQRAQSAFDYYTRISAVATMTIFLRIIKYLAQSFPRVKLLQFTISLAIPPMLVYLTFIIIIFLGFVNFSSINFASLSTYFVTFSQSVLSCVTLFFGDTSPIKTVSQSPLQNVFFMPFMLFFFIVCVQMFNAIINYSYNKACEEMEPDFERERNEIKRKQRLKEQGGARQQRGLLKSMIRTFAMLRGQTPKDEEEQDDVPGGVQKKDEDKEGFNYEELAPAIKEKVEAYLKRGQDVKEGDPFLEQVKFVIFAISYIVFLAANVNVENSFAVRSSVNVALQNATFNMKRADGEFQRMNFYEITGLPQLAAWLGQAAPDAVLERHTSWPQQFNPEVNGFDAIPTSQLCIKGWNCLMAKQDFAMRISTRRFRFVENEDEQGKSTVGTRRYHEAVSIWSGIPEDDAEIMEDRSGGQLTTTTPAAGTDPVETPNQTTLAQECEWRTDIGIANDEHFTGASGEPGVFECMIPLHHVDLQDKLDRLINEAGLCDRSLASLAVEFVVYNGNAQILDRVAYTFSVNGAGSVLPSVSHSTIKLPQPQTASEGLVMGLGALYALQVFGYLWGEIKEIREEKQKANAKTIPAIITTLLNHFTDDLFNVLDVASIVISITSIILFAIFFTTTQTYDQERTLSEYLQYMADIAGSNNLYVRLSSINVLVIFLRLLKFFRTNPRMNKLNQTLYTASTDIFAFTVIFFLALVAFMAFAFVAFGSRVEQLSTIFGALRYCFEFALGQFDYGPLQAADSLMAPVFFFPYLILFACMFLNIFFAIIDRFFVTATPPPINWKKKLKPWVQWWYKYLEGLHFPKIEWDEEFSMEEDPHGQKKSGPPSRRTQSTQSAEAIRKLNEEGSSGKNQDAKLASSIRDILLFTGPEDADKLLDDSLIEVEQWARDEAKAFVELYEKQKQKKNEARTEQQFIKTLMEDVENRRKQIELQTKRDEHKVWYSLLVYEDLQKRNQLTLSKYVLTLESKIRRKLQSLSALKLETQFLEKEIEELRCETEERDEMKHALPMEEARDDNMIQDAEPSGSPAITNVAPAAVENGTKAADGAGAALAIQDGGQEEIDANKVHEGTLRQRVRDDPHESLKRGNKPSNAPG